MGFNARLMFTGDKNLRLLVYFLEQETGKDHPPKTLHN